MSPACARKGGPSEAAASQRDRPGRRTRPGRCGGDAWAPTVCQARVASVAFQVAEGRMTVGLGRVGLVVAADVGGLALDREQLVDDRPLLRGQRLGERGEPFGEVRVVGLLGQLLRPVQAQGRSGCRGCRCRRRDGSATCPR